jgi:hypothetical protein
MKSAVVGGLNSLTIGVALRPPVIADDHRKRLTQKQLRFLQLKAQEIMDWRARRAPLGMTPRQYRWFRASLHEAADRDGLSGFDVRLKGSAAVFFSGTHKPFPASVDSALQLAKANGRKLTRAQEAEIERAYDSFSSKRSRPKSCPFDSMFRLGLSRWRSDYDVQISGAEVAERCRTVFERENPSSRGQLVRPEYGFFEDKWFDEACPAIASWRDHCSATLGRNVNVKAFDAKGPPNKTAKIGSLSGHFRKTDWMLREPDDQE